MNNQKTKEEILEQSYMTAADIKLLIPDMGINNCRSVIKELRDEMKNKGLYVPETKPRVALTKIVKKKFGL